MKYCVVKFNLIQNSLKKLINQKRPLLGVTLQRTLVRYSRDMTQFYERHRKCLSQTRRHNFCDAIRKASSDEESFPPITVKYIKRVAFTRRQNDYNYKKATAKEESLLCYGSPKAKKKKSINFIQVLQSHFVVQTKS